ncbi:MAG TPA: sigma-70 family RNA polymerase sigma factor [Lacipirellulaceae bacterium]|jgi:RNA polymerase sigma factor (sigma-70 family)|nr:sigma-70 family RNA polymerase sigma factor [Lacipirellulaceae bacterium]
MAFPQTRHTLIERLAVGGTEHDWRDFLVDYWNPVCRFALRRGNGRLEEAEDVTGQAFEIVLRNKLLARWAASRQAKLRTLLCSVVCKIQANAFRAAKNRECLLDELRKEQEAAVGDEDAFYAAWIDELLQKSLHELATDYHREGKGDYFRVLYGRLCEQMSIAEVAEALGISSSAVDNYYRHVRQRLSQKLESAVRSHVIRYTPAEEAEAEFATEWGRFGTYLKDHGGLDEAVRQAHALMENSGLQKTRNVRIRQTLSRIERPNET